MAKLAREMTCKQLEEVFNRSMDFGRWERSLLKKPIHMLVSLRKKRTTDVHYLDTLADLLQDVSNARSLYNDVIECRVQVSADAGGAVRSNALPNGFSHFQPNDAQKKAFKDVLMKISVCLDPDDFEIIKALSPIPDGRKERASEGYMLFDKLKEFGRISENDVELLDDFFTTLDLVRPLELLARYRRDFPMQHCDPPPTAPILLDRVGGAPGHHTPSQPTQMCGNRMPHPQQPGHALSTHHIVQVPVQPSTTLYSRPPGYLDQNYPRLSTTAPSTQSPPPHSQAAGTNPHQVGGFATAATVPPTVGGNVSTMREGISPSNPAQRVPSQSPLHPISNPLHPFQKQISFPPRPPHHGGPFPSPTQHRQQQHHPAITPASYSIQSPPPPPPAHTPSPPVPTAVPPHTQPDPIPSPLPSPHEPLTQSEPASFPEPLTAQSQGDRCSPALPQQHQLQYHPSPPPSPAATPPLGTIGAARTPPPPRSSSYGLDRSSHSLPHELNRRDKLLAKQSREMNTLTHSELSRQPDPGGAPQVAPLRTVFSRESVGAAGVVGSSASGDNLLSINESALRGHSLAQPGYDEGGCPRSSAGQSGSSASQSGSISFPSRLVSSHPNTQSRTQPGSLLTHPTSPHYPSQVSDRQSQVYHHLPSQPPPLAAGHLTQHGLLAMAHSSVAPVVHGSMAPVVHGSMGSSGGSSYLVPHNTLNSSQFVSHNSSFSPTLLSSPLSSHSYQRGSVHHDPSTRSLVERHQLQESQGASQQENGSNSFSTIPEERGDREGEDDDWWSESEESYVEITPLKRPREESESSSSDEEEEGEEEEEREGEGGGGDTTKRVRTEKEEEEGRGSGGILGSIRSIFSRFSQRSKKKDNSSDEEK